MRKLQHGFTLVELIMVIVILGIVGGMVAVFIRGPIDAYFASARRAGLTDVADTTVRRMGRDIRKALPNSVRTPSGQCVEFIPTKTGGRYRADGAGALGFSGAVTSFNELGDNTDLNFRPAGQAIAVGDVVVVYNLGIAGADAYASNNTAPVVAPAPAVAGSAPETTINIASTTFPLASGSNRFHVVPSAEQVVSYVCDTTAGNERLLRTTSTFANAATTSCSTTGVLPGGSTRAVLATHVTNCSFDYTGPDLQRNALVRMSLQLTDSDETVSLQHEVHVNNTP